MRDWLERNFRGSLNAEGIFQSGNPEGVKERGKGDIGRGVYPLTRISLGSGDTLLDPGTILQLANSLMECKSIESLKNVLVKDLNRVVEFDMGSIKWKPLNPEDAEPSPGFIEDEMVYSLDFSTRESLRPGDEPVCGEDEIGSLDSPTYVDCYNGSYRARSDMGDPLLISLKSALFIPLQYGNERIATLSLFSSKPRNADRGMEEALSPVWSMIGKSLGRILETESLKADLQRSRDLLDGTDDMIILWKNTGSMWEIDCNEIAERLIDLDDISPDLMEGPFFVPPGREWERAFVAWTAAYQSGETNQIGLDLINREGETISYLCKFSPLTVEGNLMGVRMTGVEMEMLDSGAKKMESSNRTYRLLLSVLSHDLRNPLAAIRGYNELMEFSDEEKRLSYMKQISNLTRRMNDMISLANTFNKLQEGRVETTFEMIDLKEMIDRCLELLYPRTEEHVVIFSPGDSDFKIKGHKLIEEVILNLIENAMKYSEKGSEIKIGLSADLSGVVISISDRGEGIPDQYKETIFERFSRLNKESGILGSGLGLAISREIVSMHGGRIWVVDNEGGGARFNVFLPWEP